MLTLKREDGDWLTITHRSGDVLRIRVYDVRRGAVGSARLAFDDAAGNFDIQRRERPSYRRPHPETRPDGD